MESKEEYRNLGWLVSRQRFGEQRRSFVTLFKVTHLAVVIILEKRENGLGTVEHICRDLYKFQYFRSTKNTYSSRPLRRGCASVMETKGTGGIRRICVHFAGRPREWRAISISRGYKRLPGYRAAVSERPQFDSTCCAMRILHFM